VRDAERVGPEQYPLYRWTKDTIENPEKKAKYQKSFTVYVGGEQVYEKETADWLHAQLSAFVGKAAAACAQVRSPRMQPGINCVVPTLTRCSSWKCACLFPVLMVVSSHAIN
jgi:hypothetical protein